MGPRNVWPLALLAVAAPLAAQDSTQQAQAMQQMMQQIVRDRPPQAEMTARDEWRTFGLSPTTLDSLRAQSPGEYWGEVAQLTIQHEMASHVADAVRTQLMIEMFGEEAQARILQRLYRSDSTQEGTVRQRLQLLLDKHFGAEDSLRTLEMADVERRLAQVRAEAEQRRKNRAAVVKQMVDQVLADARRH